MIRSGKMVLSGVILAIFLLVPIQLAFAAPVKVGSSNLVASDPKLAVSGSYVYAVWEVGLKGGIKASISSNNGLTWGVPFYLTTARSQEPHIAATGPNVYVTWTQLSIQGRRVIELRYSHDYGSTWSVARDLSSPSFRSDTSRLVASGSDVFVTWIDKSWNSAKIMFVASHDNGTAWGNAIVVSKGTGNSGTEAITVQPGVVFLAWQQVTIGVTQIQFSASMNDGASFSMPVNVSNDAGNATQPVLSSGVDSNGNNVFVAWQDNASGNNEIMFKVSHNDGMTWGSAINLSNSQTSSTAPSILVLVNGAESSVVVIWTGTISGGSVVMSSTSSTTGASFGRPVDVSQGTVNSTSPRIEARVGSSSMTVVWMSTAKTGATDVYASTSSINGAVWSLPLNLSNDGHASQPRIIDDGSLGSKVYVVWTDSTAVGSSYISFATM